MIGVLVISLSFLPGGSYAAPVFVSESPVGPFGGSFTIASGPSLTQEAPDEDYTDTGDPNFYTVEPWVSIGFDPRTNPGGGADLIDVFMYYVALDPGDPTSIDLPANWLVAFTMSEGYIQGEGGGGSTPDGIISFDTSGAGISLTSFVDPLLQDDGDRIRRLFVFYGVSGTLLDVNTFGDPAYILIGTLASGDSLLQASGGLDWTINLRNDFYDGFLNGVDPQSVVSGQFGGASGGGSGWTGGSGSGVPEFPPQAMPFLYLFFGSAYWRFRNAFLRK
jgi:hypothetical protein